MLSVTTERERERERERPTTKLTPVHDIQVK
jgi:hypothetical protein